MARRAGPMTELSKSGKGHGEGKVMAIEENCRILTAEEDALGGSSGKFPRSR